MCTTCQALSHAQRIQLWTKHLPLPLSSRNQEANRHDYEYNNNHSSMKAERDLWYFVYFCISQQVRLYLGHPKSSVNIR